jgi:hypothetical protein
VREALLLIDAGQGLGIVAFAAIGAQDTGEVGQNHLPYLLVAMPAAGLVDGRRLGCKGHELGRLAAHPPASVVGVHPFGLGHARPKRFIRRADWPLGLP